jgi:predicted TIM-barrel fold metal-dependent hydrolase
MLAATQATVVAVDCHAHVMRMSRALAEQRHSAPMRDIEASDFIQMLDAHGISHGVLTAPSFYGSDNTLLLEALGRYPDRLRGTAIVEPAIQDEQLEAMARAGVRGIRLNWIRRPSLPDAAGPAYQKLFGRVRDLGWHVEVYLEGQHLPQVLPALRRSGVHVVLDHFASPEPRLGLQCAGLRLALQAMEAGSTWVKLSAPYRLGGADPAAYVQAFMRAAGPERLMWGSDWPWVQHENDGFTYQDCLDWLGAWVPDDNARRIILAETPRLLFGF